MVNETKENNAPKPMLRGIVFKGGEDYCKLGSSKFGDGVTRFCPTTKAAF